MPLNIYYLDDEPELLELFTDTFSSEEIKITTFSSPQAAVAAARKTPPDVIFLDYRLPNTTGDRVALEMDPKIPKVLITGDLNVALSAKFDAVLAKPYATDEVRQLIRRITPVNG